MCRVNEIPKPSNHAEIAPHNDANIFVLTEATQFEEENPKTIDLDEIKSDSDLADLKKKDPFMFYSIPSVQKTVMEGQRVELPTINKAIAVKESTVVKRSRRISFESIDNGMSMLFGLHSGDGPQHDYETDTDSDDESETECKDSFDLDAYLDANSKMI